MPYLGRVLLLAGASLAAGAHWAWAWTPRTQLAIAERAAELAPPDLRAQIVKHPREFRRGALGAFSDPDPQRHARDADGYGTLDAVIAEEAAGVVSLIQGHRPFAEIVYQLGRLAHFVADASNPLNASSGDPQEASYFADFLQYAEHAMPRFAVVFYGLDGRLNRAPDLRPLAGAALQRSRALYPRVGAEYRRVGRVAGTQFFDDRSTAFAVAAISFSHAVSDTANAFRYVWLRAGGADPRALPAAAERRLVLLEPAPAPAPAATGATSSILIRFD